ncbi:hypothetical protein QQS21_008031 [Conoideocrella luteorostrata]|uniref:Fe2OG dioxygenase domain-containing protein n=1 Tax=Conoideocrella luteorostrata TaxID=1105319 RepID=A0AAJ0FRT8_9HYPO|nr:hypothetical protein QQS21_008031 [Conoideocrella luteorostrata]
MATELVNPASPDITYIRVASPTGPVTRTVLRTPLRDALPSEIPVIDISPIFSPHLEDREAVARQVNHAATNIGFFYIKNHGVETAVIQDTYNAALEFYRQDLDQKLKATVAQSSRYNGYRAPDTMRLNPDEGLDLREAFSITYDPRLDPNVTHVQDIPAIAKEHLTMEDHHFTATQNVPNFKSATTTYFRSCLALARALTRTFALSLGLPETTFDSKIAYPDVALNMNYYPPIRDGGSVEPGDPDAGVSIGSHTDFQLFTILWQDMVGGLQVLNRNGQWINAKPMPDTFVVNIADCLQRITNDKYVSTIHRAQNWSGKERVSFAFFWGFGLHETCEVLKNCIEAGEKKKYEDIQCWEWLRKRVDDMTQLDKEKEA